MPEDSLSAKAGNRFPVRLSVSERREGDKKIWTWHCPGPVTLTRPRACVIHRTQYNFMLLLM